MSLVSTKVGDDGEDDSDVEDDDPAAWPKYEEMTFLRVRMCKCCRHSSNEPNPVTTGPNATWPSWPWRYGSPRAPSGAICRFCPTLLGLAGFKNEFRTLGEVAEKMKTSETLADEWRAAHEQLIKAFNSGRLKKKIRGNVRTVVNGELSKIRTRVVETIKRTGMRTIEKFRAVALTKWKKKFPGRDPVEDGFLVRVLPIKNEKVECVLIRKLPDMEWDLELDTSLDVLMKETMDDGSLSLRESQQDNVFESHAKGLQGISSTACPNGVADMRKFERIQKKEDDKQPDGGDDDSMNLSQEIPLIDVVDEEGGSQGSGNEDSNDVFSSSLMSDFAPAPTAVGAAAKPRTGISPSKPSPSKPSPSKPSPAKVATKKTSPGPAQRSRSPRSTKPGSLSAGADPRRSRSRSRSPMGKARGKGKRSKFVADGDVEDVLSADGFGKLLEGVLACMRPVRDAPCDDADPTPPTWRQLNKILKEAGKVATKAHKECWSKR